MSISCVVAAFGGKEWHDLAQRRAAPSTEGQGFSETIVSYLSTGTLAQARNEGAERASGKWLLFLDADDELSPGFGSSMLRASRSRKRKTLFTPSVQYVSDRRRQPPRIWPRCDFRDGNWCVIGTMIERAFFFELGGFEEWGLYEDWALWARADSAGAEVVEVPEAVYIAHATTTSRNRSPRTQERLYWHQAIGHCVWPELYDAPTLSEERTRHLRTTHLRRVG